MSKPRDWGDVGAEGGPGAIRREGDDPATDIPFDNAPPAQTNGEASFTEEELRGPPDGPSNWQTPGEGVSLDDFRAFMEMHAYIFTPSGAMWPASSVNSRIPPIPLVDKNGEPLLDDEGKQRKISAAGWLDKHRPVETMTWAPGEPMLIPDRLISDGGWISRKGVPRTCHRMRRRLLPMKLSIRL
jgi:hypothetical protein